MLFIRVTLGLPRPLCPSILPSSNNLWIDLALITCPRSYYLLVIMDLFYLPSLKLLDWFYVPSMILLIFLYAPTFKKPPIYFPWFWPESMFHNHIIILTVYVCKLVFLDLSTLDISWNALFANAIVRFTSFSHLQSAVRSPPK